MRPQQSDAPGRANPFARYSGEQVQQIPAGYVEAMGSMGGAFLNAGKAIAGQVSEDRQLESKSKQTSVDQAKVDALEAGNKIKERALDVESSYKAYSLMTTAEKDQYERVRDAHKATQSMVGTLKDRIDSPETSAADKKQAALDLAQANTDLQGFTKKMTLFANKEPMSFDEFQKNQEKVRQERIKNSIPANIRKPESAPTATPATQSTSYYQSPAFQSPAYTGQGSDVTKTVAFGGSPKKAEVVGGRVSSIVSPDGTKTRIGGWVSENALPEINQVVTAVEASNAGSAYGTASATPTPAETPAAVEEKVELNGPLKSRYVHSEPLEPITGSKNTNPRMGTILFNEQTSPSTGQVVKTPVVNFDSKKLQNADGSPNIEAHMALRKLTLINEVLRSGDHLDVRPDKAESDAADDEIGSTANAFDMPAIRKAYALVSRNINNDMGSPIEATMFGIRFEEKFGMSPSVFMASGDTVDEIEITPSAQSALDQTLKERVAKRLNEVGNAPWKPSGIDDVLKSTGTEIDRIERELKRTEKYISDPAYEGTDFKAAQMKKQQSLMRQLELTKSKQSQAQTLTNNWEVENRQYQQRQDAIAKELALDESMQRLEKGKREQAQDISKLTRRWIGITSSDWKKTNGFVAQGLENIPRMTARIPIVINGKPTGSYYKDRLDPAELLRQLEKNGDYATISRITRNMPTDDQIDDKKNGIAETQKKYDEAIFPLHELNKLNELYLKEAGKGVTGEMLTVPWMKLWQSDPLMSTSGTYQKTLVGKIREAIVGPGNPSNYEQEVISSIVPNTNDILTRPTRQKARVQALATITMLNHYNVMVANGLKPTELSIKMYSKQLGDILGYNVSPETFKGMFDDWNRQRTIYTNNESIGSENPALAKEYTNKLLDSLEARAKERK